MVDSKSTCQFILELSNYNRYSKSAILNTYTRQLFNIILNVKGMFSMEFGDILGLIIMMIGEFIAGGIILGGVLVFVIVIGGMFFSGVLKKLKIKNSSFFPPFPVIWTCYIIGGLCGAIRCAIIYFR